MQRALELQRLDELQIPFYRAAIDGDMKATNVVLGIMERRARLLGLDMKRANEPAEPVTITVVGGPAVWPGAAEEDQNGASNL